MVQENTSTTFLSKKFVKSTENTICSYFGNTDQRLLSICMHTGLRCTQRMNCGDTNVCVCVSE